MEVFLIVLAIVVFIPISFYLVYMKLKIENPSMFGFKTSAKEIKKQKIIYTLFLLGCIALLMMYRSGFDLVSFLGFSFIEVILLISCILLLFYMFKRRRKG